MIKQIITIYIYIITKIFNFIKLEISGCVLLFPLTKFIRNAAVARCRTTLEIFSFTLGISSFNLLRFSVSPVSTSRSFYALTISYVYIITKIFKKIKKLFYGTYVGSITSTAITSAILYSHASASSTESKTRFKMLPAFNPTN